MNVKKSLALFQDTKIRSITVVLLIVGFALALVGFLIYEHFKPIVLPTDVVVETTPAIRSVPGVTEAPREYVKLQETQNTQQAAQALKEMTAAVPTLTRATYVNTDDLLGGANKSLQGCGLEDLQKARTAGVESTELRCRGCSLSALKAAGYTAGELMKAGYSARELQQAGFSAQELKNAGFSIKDIVAAGYNIADLKAASFGAAELKNAGFEASVLQKAGFTAGDLRNAGFNAKDLVGVGVSAATLRSVGYGAKELGATGLVAKDLIAAGFSPDEIKNAGFSAKDLLNAGISSMQLKKVGFLNDDLKKAGLSSNEINKANLALGECSLEKLKQMRAQQANGLDLKKLSCDASALKNAGFTAAELKNAGFSAQALMDAGFSAKDLKDAGFSPQELKNVGFSAKDLKEAGFSASDLKEAGFKAEDLKAIGVSAKELNNAGYLASDLKKAGFSAGELKNADFSASDLIKAGFIPKDLKDAGFTAEALRKASVNIDNLKAAGYTDGDLIRAGFDKAALGLTGVSTISPSTEKNAETIGTCSLENLKKQRDSGMNLAEISKMNCSVRALKAAGFQAAELKKAGFSDQDLRDIYLKDDALNDQNNNVAANPSDVNEEGKNINTSTKALGAEVSLVSTPNLANENTAWKHLDELRRQNEQQLSAQEYQEGITRNQQAFSTQANELMGSWMSVQTQQYTAGDNEGGEAVAGGGGLNTQAENANNLTKADVYKAGTILFATLDTGINSDEQSPILATIATGKLSGAKLVGGFQRVDKKVVLQFGVLSVPYLTNSIGINCVAIDQNTAHTALATNVDNHYLLRYGSLFASSFVSGLAQAIQTSGSQTTSTLGPGGIIQQNTFPQLNTTQKALVALGNVGQQMSTMLSPLFNTPPTVEVKEGSAIGILIMSDLSVPKKTE